MLSQFVGTEPPFDTLDGLARWAHGLGFVGVQIPVHDERLIDLKRIAQDQGEADDLLRRLADCGVSISELAAHRAGQLMAVHPAYDVLSDVFAPHLASAGVAEKRAFAENTLGLAIEAAARLGIDKVATFSGSLAWPYFYPWPPPPRGLVDRAFDELAARWKPVIHKAADAGVALCFELHPGEDLHDGATFERFLDRLDGHPSIKLLYDPSHMLLQHMDYLRFLDRYLDRIAAFHVKDAEFIPSERAGVYGGYLDWPERPGRFRSPGDGQIDFAGIFSRLAAHGYDGWAVLEWECYLKHPHDGAREGARFIADHIIRVSDTMFDAPLRASAPDQKLDTILGLSP